MYHRNLSGAYQLLNDYESADRELESAYQLDKNETLRRQEKAILANAQGYDAYDKGNYRKAVEYYTKAVDLNPSRAIYHTNLAGAWGRLKEPGKREHGLDQAIQCYERAQEVTKKRDYTEQINRLRRRKEIVRIYGERALDYLAVVTPVAVEVAADLIPYVQSTNADLLSDELLTNVNKMRAAVLEQFGVKIPGLRFRGTVTGLPKGTYIVMINEIPLVSGNLSTERRFCTASEEDLSRLGIESEPGSEPVSGRDGSWIDRGDWEKIESQKFELWGVTQYLVRHVEAVLRKNLGEFLGHQEIVNLLESTSGDVPVEIRASPTMVTALTTVCKALLAEEVPIQPFQELCATFSELYAKNVSLREIAEQIRVVPAFRGRLPGNDRQYSLLKLDTNFETEIRHSLYQHDGRAILTMEPQDCQDALSAVRDRASGGHVALAVEDATLRPFIRKLVELEFPELHVLSQDELRPDVEFKKAGIVNLDKEPTPEGKEFRSSRAGEPAIVEDIKESVAALPLSNIQLEVFVGEGFAAHPSPVDDKSFPEMFSMMLDGLFYELGTVLPEVRVETDSNLKSGEFRIRLNGIEHGPVSDLHEDEFLVNDTVDRLTLLGIGGREHINPANGNECAIVRDTHDEAARCQQAELTTWGPRGYLVLYLSSHIRKAAAQFQTDELTQYILDSLGEAFPELVQLVLQRYSLAQISWVLRELLDEEISIRDLRTILESLLSIDGMTDVDLSRFIVFLAYTDNLCPASSAGDIRELTPADLTNFVRTSLKRHITHKYTRGGNTLLVYLLDSAIEQRIAETSVRPLTDEEKEKLHAVIREEVQALPAAATVPTLLTTFEVRRTLRRLIERQLPQLAVLSYQELSPDVNIQPIARISWS